MGAFLVGRWSGIQRMVQEETEWMPINKTNLYSLRFLKKWKTLVCRLHGYFRLKKVRVFQKPDNLSGYVLAGLQKKEAVS